MSDDLVFSDELGPQNDGEPIAVVEKPPVEEEKPVENAPEPEEKTEEEHEEDRKKKTGSQRAREKVLRLEAENEALRRALAERKPEPAPVAAQPAGKPRPEDFNSHEEWVEALSDWKTEQKLAEREARRQQEQRVQTWNQKADEARSRYEDFDEALQDAPAPSQHVAEVLSDSPIGADLAYHLATHPTEYKRINSLGPVAAARELGLIEARLSAKKEPTSKPQVTKAPKPPTPVSPAAVYKPSDDGRYEEY